MVVTLAEICTVHIKGSHTLFPKEALEDVQRSDLVDHTWRCMQLSMGIILLLEATSTTHLLLVLAPEDAAVYMLRALGNISTAALNQSRRTTYQKISTTFCSALACKDDLSV